MAKNKKEIKIIKKDSNKEDYTFVNDSIIKNIKNKESANGENKSEKKSDERIEKKIYTTKSQHKGRKILGKSLQGHSPIYE
ncbi:MAG: hypothetical protein K0S93_2344 [Nitrososphaeraceae archaeon]|jgi:hypothetical protein|nr:hypothetical protein [Nitrososphaeraceae archaeon]